MLLVPRQLMRSGMTGDVPYYGSPLTPAQAYAALPSLGAAARSAAHRQSASASRGSGVATADGGPRDPPDPIRRRRWSPARFRSGHRGGVRRAADPDQAVTGPVQVLVIGFDQFTPSGEVMAELDRLREAGTARLLDVLFVERAADGTMETLPAPAGAPRGPRHPWRPASLVPRIPTFRILRSRPMARRGPWPTPSRSARPPRRHSSSISGRNR